MTLSSRKRVDGGLRAILLLTAFVSLAAVILITLYLFSEGLPAFRTIPLGEFLFSSDWSPSAAEPHYGIAVFVEASLVVTVLALLLATPFSLSAAIYLALLSKGWKRDVIKTGVSLLAGIPSVIFGLFGIAVIVPMVRIIWGGNGYSLLSAALILAIMIMPTIINVTEVSLASVDHTLHEASYGLGATRTQTIFKVIIPAARQGIVSAFLLGLGRAVGETTAVLLVGGNAPLAFHRLTDRGRTLTMNIVTDMGYAEGTHMQALFATAMLLYLCILVSNGLVVIIARRKQ